MLKIGLTGGIGSGKTAASNHFARLGAEVIDTDILSRELVQPGQPALQEIVAAFGSTILSADGHLDRDALRARIFSDTDARRKLETILHPRIREAMLERADDSSAPYVVLVIPLLLETGQQSLVDRVLVIDVPADVQRARVAARNGLGDAEINAILATQVDRSLRLRAADDLITNDGPISKLHAEVARLHQKYMEQVQH